MYAWGEDYHDVLRDKLRALEQQMRAMVSEPFKCRICVDTAPIIERELAAAIHRAWPMRRNTDPTNTANAALLIAALRTER